MYLFSLQILCVAHSRCLSNENSVFSHENGGFSNENGVSLMRAISLKQELCLSNESGDSPRRAASLIQERCPLTRAPPIDLLAEERKETFQLRKELTCLTKLQEIARAKEAIRKDERRRLVEKWQTRWHGDQSGRWTHRLIPELVTWLDRKHGPRRPGKESSYSSPGWRG